MAQRGQVCTYLDYFFKQYIHHFESNHDLTLNFFPADNSDFDQALIVDLGKIKNVTGIATQGRAHRYVPNDKQWAKNRKIV